MHGGQSRNPWGRRPPLLAAAVVALLLLAGCAGGGGGTAAPSTTATTAAPLAPSSPTSPYEGTYMGMFQYTVHAKADRSGESHSGGVRLTLELTAGNASAPGPGGWVLQAVRVQASDPYFGCELGCVPLDAGILLPAQPPTTPSSPSAWGQGISIVFPNGRLLQTNAQGTGYVHVATDARTVANDLSVPAGDRWQALDSGASADWSDDVISGRDAFHASDCPNGCEAITFDSWSLTKSAL